LPLKGLEAQQRWAAEGKKGGQESSDDDEQRNTVH
jgi:hypothetical protein